MALTPKWEQVQDAEVQQSLAGNHRLVRTAFVTGIASGTVTSSKTALLEVLESPLVGAPALGEEFSPAYPQYICIHRIIRGVPNSGGSMARIWAHYETAGGGGTPIERFAAEDSSSSILEPKVMFPGTAQQLLCSVTSSSPDYNLATQPAAVRPITASFPHTTRALILYGLFNERPGVAVRRAANKVNNAPWQGLPTGYWKAENPSCRYSSATGLFAVTVGFLNKGEDPGDDWSTYEIAVNPDTGQKVFVTEDVLNPLYAQAYEYGVMNDKNGVWKGGMLKTWDFSGTFGDTFPIGD